MRILCIPGSLRRESYNRSLLAAAAEVLPHEVELVTWAELGAVPPFSEDDEDSPAPPVQALREAIATSDAVLIATAEYNGSLPGQLKNALDWASRPFPNNVLRDKPAAVIGASPSPGGAGRAQAEARVVLGRIGAQVIDIEVRVPHAHEQFDGSRRLVDPNIRDALHRLTDALTSAAAATSGVA